MAEQKKKCILVIDDEDSVCQIIKEKFEGVGYQVLKAHDGIDGLRKTEQAKPDCVILDILIPKSEDGFTYLHSVRSYSAKDPQEQARVRNTPVIALTGAGPSLKDIFESEKISGFIEKPFDLSDLQKEVERALRPR